MRKISIALDCDGVLADFCSGALQVVEEVTGKKFKASAVTGQDFTTALSLSPQEIQEVKNIISNRQGFVAALPRYPTARQGVRRLRTLGDVFCVTTPWPASAWWQAERSSWLALHFGIDHIHYAANNDKTIYEADVFVDDSADHVSAWLAAWPGRTAVLWRNLHNTKEALPPGTLQTSSWEDLYQIAKRVARETLQTQPQVQVS